MTARWTRRQVLTGAALAAAAGAASGVGGNLSALASITVGGRTRETGGDALVVLFLRGGADGLNMVIPYEEDDYHRRRPTLALARPKDGRAASGARALDLDGFFGLHPALAALLPLYREGKFAIVHAIGSGDQTRSHFEAMATMERGLEADTGSASGWLARHLTATAAEGDSPLRAVAIADTMPDSLRGAISATALMSLADFRLAAPTTPPKGENNRTHHLPNRAQALTETLEELYSKATVREGAGRQPAVGSREPTPNPPHVTPVVAAGRETLAALEAVKRLDPANYRPASGAIYPDDIIGNGFRQAACLVKGNIGLEVACLDMNGWDTHAAQGRDAGWQPNLLRLLGQAVAAFFTDIGPQAERVTLLVMTEFGRRAYENFSLGTDHGRASCLFVLGGGVQGGKVYGEWPGLAADQLDDQDLRVTTDYRDVLAEILVRRLKNPDLGGVFPQYTPRFRNLVRPA